jgi:tRNA modification GTPase
MREDTIFALGTGAGRAAIAIIRLSGEAVSSILVNFAGGVPEPRETRLASLRDPLNDEILDRGIIFFVPGPNSPTGEDYAELQCHGGRAIVSALLAALSRQQHVRMAEPGEFVRRGFANGKLDLSQAEGLADLIDAETQSQRRQALRLSGGVLRRKVEAWRSALIASLALIEAQLDFSDEADVERFSYAALKETLSPIVSDMAAALAVSPASERMREGFSVMILGPPNAGKSTLINKLIDREIAIVSSQPGTTRDMIEAHLEVEGLPVTFIDTAGLREASDEIEQMGIDRVYRRLPAADLILWLSPQEAPPPLEVENAQDILFVRSKIDLNAPSEIALGICSLTGAGLDDLLAKIAEKARAQLGAGDVALFARQRHRVATQAAYAAIRHALKSEKPLEFIADDLRLAARSLGKIIGDVDVKDILDVVFSRFCIGK